MSDLTSRALPTDVGGQQAGAESHITSIIRFGHPFDDVYRVRCTCGWASIPLGAEGAGRAKVQHWKEHR